MHTPGAVIARSVAKPLVLESTVLAGTISALDTVKRTTAPTAIALLDCFQELTRERQLVACHCPIARSFTGACWGGATVSVGEVCGDKSRVVVDTIVAATDQVSCAPVVAVAVTVALFAQPALAQATHLRPRKLEALA